MMHPSGGHTENQSCTEEGRGKKNIIETMIRWARARRSVWVHVMQSPGGACCLGKKYHQGDRLIQLSRPAHFGFSPFFKKVFVSKNSQINTKRSKKKDKKLQKMWDYTQWMVNKGRQERQFQMRSNEEWKANTSLLASWMRRRTF